MAKRRTRDPYYGKLSQRLNTAAAQALKAGNKEEAKALFDKAKEVQKKRREG